jgi:hypothetical protein
LFPLSRGSEVKPISDPALKAELGPFSGLEASKILLVKRYLVEHFEKILERELELPEEEGPSDSLLDSICYEEPAMRRSTHSNTLEVYRLN